MQRTVFSSLVVLAAGLVCGGADAASVGVRHLGNARSASSVLHTTPTAKKSRESTSSASAASATTSAPRLSVGRLHTNAGKTRYANNGDGPLTSLDPSEYALAADMNALERRLTDVDVDLQKKIDDLWVELDAVKVGDLKLAVGEYTGD